ncbi:hypothetical protein SSX86_006565 [Deinandra increscens subsp. villosa]|uniref:DUF8039 domain-containing protein n=1 Tax=Deinandra increscens subsp. villosa TaxID=3103831 RepID=A0AAP0DGA3_9ASTR
MSIYNHHLGRGGYARLDQKLVESKVIDAGTMPSRSWYKVGEIEDEAAKAIAAEIMKTEKKIIDGQLKLDPGNDAMTVVLGKEKCGSLRGVGTGVNPSKFFNVPRQSTTQLSPSITNVPVTPLGADSEPDMISQKESADTEVTPDAAKKTKKKAPSNATANKFTRKDSTRAGFIEAAKTRQNKAEAKKKDALTRVAVTTPSAGIINIKCKLAYPTKRQIVGLGTVYLSEERQYIHGVPLQDDCYKVSVDEVKDPVLTTPEEENEDEFVQGQKMKRKFITRDDIMKLKKAKKNMV